MKSFLKKSFVSPAFLSGLLVAITACDFHGPWEYYPEEREVYTGIYTYGHISDFTNPEICFSKVYELDEAAAENFAFYDSAYVTLQGKFKMGENEYDTTIVMRTWDKPNCFKANERGILGESYTMDAYFVWDSAGSTAKSRYTAVASIPKPVKVTGLNIPKQDGSYEFREYTDGKVISVDFLEFPMDMEFVKCALDFDKSIGGVLSVLNYDMETEESVNTTINQMLEGLTEADDSTGYRGIAMHDPFERRQNLGYSENRWIGGFNNLDTLYLMNMMLPIGRISVDMYTTDRAYVDYERKVKESVSDSRVVPESNIENGMGVFFGMSRTSLELNVRGEGVTMEYIGFHNCDYIGNGDEESWETRACRLYQDIACSGMPTDDFQYDLVRGNAHAYEYYREGTITGWAKTCYPSNVKAAMMLDTTRWSIFLPDTISNADKSEAYADGLKRYCVASNFKSNHIADCSELEELCLQNTEKNYCKEYLWEWCADRDWDMLEYEQCRSAFVSRYYLEEQKSSILKREVEEICNYAFPKVSEDEDVDAEFRTPICANWCKYRDGKSPLRVICE